MTDYKFKNVQRNSLLRWYRKNCRPLPWREDRDPYKVWISETMLQQTTTTAVIPYFERFIGRFPTLEALGTAKEESVVQAWAGLGYYSRARNVHKAAQLFLQNGGLPSSFDQLIEYPGLGPYTSRSVASIAFGQNVGVLDGNVIRVLCRFFHLDWQWWKTAEKRTLQGLADNAVLNQPANEINQALMELGATTCTPQSPKCNHCPWQSSCSSYKESDQDTLPIAKPKRSKEIWLWTPTLVHKAGKVVICKNDYAPFLKKQWFLPGKIAQLQSQPAQFDFRHVITHHNIFVKLAKPTSVLKKSHATTDIKWVDPSEISHWSPSSLVTKALHQGGLTQP